MPTFYLTVGQKYRHESHPCGLHPDGWAEIDAPTEEDAHYVAFAYMGPQFCRICTEPQSLELYPRGCIRRFKHQEKE